MSIYAWSWNGAMVDIVLFWIMMWATMQAIYRENDGFWLCSNARKREVKMIILIYIDKMGAYKMNYVFRCSLYLYSVIFNSFLSVGLSLISKQLYSI